MQLISREYAVAVARRTEQDNVDLGKLSFSLVPNSKAYWVADPFPIEVDGELYIFGEVFEYIKDKGSIGYTKYIDGKFTPWKIVLEEEYHMSFPYLFYIDNVLYMCPEANQSKQLYLYKCVDFPEKWVKDRVLIDGGNYSDTIFYRKDGSVYGFTCVWNGINDHTFKVFRVDNDNCVFSEGEIKTLEYFLTRPAGKVYKDNHDGRDVIVSQICQPLYGSGLIFKEFELYWPNYSEKELFRVFPSEINVDVKKNYVGMHTYNVTENYVVIDLIWNRFSLAEKVLHFMKRIAKRR